MDISLYAGIRFSSRLGAARYTEYIARYLDVVSILTLVLSAKFPGTLAALLPPLAMGKRGENMLGVSERTRHKCPCYEVSRIPPLLRGFVE